jgi:hypothetical protein
MSPTCLMKPMMNSCSVCPGFVRRVFEHPVHRLRDCLRLIRIGQANDEESRVTRPELVGLVDIGIVEVHAQRLLLRGFVASVEDSDKVERPVLAAVALRKDLRLDWNLAADLPSLLLGHQAPGDHAGSCTGESAPLLIGHHPLRRHRAQAHRIDRERTDLRVFPEHAGEPERMRHRLHAGNLLDLRLQPDRQWLRDQHFCLRYQPRRADETDIGPEQHVDGLEQPEQQERAHHRQQGERGARFAAKQVRHDESGLGHRLPMFLLQDYPPGL